MPLLTLTDRECAIIDTPIDGIAFYAAWDRKGREVYSKDPAEAIRAAYFAKYPGCPHKPVLLIARVRSEDSPHWLGGTLNTYSVPMGYHEPSA